MRIQLLFITIHRDDENGLPKIDLYTLTHSIEMCTSFSVDDEPHGTK